MTSPGTTIDIDGLPGFWQQLGVSDHAILLLDYDGTLAPFHPDRMLAKPLDGVLPALETLIELRWTTVALISGRPVAEIQQLTRLDNLIIVGTHGFEIYRPCQGIARQLPDGTVVERLDAIEEIAAEIVGEDLAERKIATVALHTRKLDPARADEASRYFRDRVEPLAGDALQIRDFNGGVEVRVPARDKGVAISEIIDELPTADLIVYIGDDDTDEDGFKALPENGVGIKVGPPEIATAAAGRLASCEDVLRFLNNWIATRS